MFGEMKNDLDMLGSLANLGHAGRNEAFVRQIKNMCFNAGGTASGSNSEMADCVSAYRFAGNEQLDLDILRETQMKTTLESCGEDETILVINDISLLDYCGHESKKDRRRIGNELGKGYEFACNLGVALESERVLGVLHSCLINADGPDDSKVIDYHGDPLFKELSKNDPERLERNHKHMLNCHFKHISENASNRHMIAVGDREFDDHFIFEGCLEQRQDFVIRSNAVRNVQVSEDLEWLPEKKTMKYPGLPLLPDHVCFSMKHLIENVSLSPYKKIPLDGKGRLTDEKTAKSHASVSVGAFPVVLYRNAKRNKTYVKPRDYISLNVVVVKETAPPDGREGISWVIYTSLPVETLDQIGKVVRIYELRWLIECFFKYLKSGFKLEDVRYDNARKTAIHIVVISIATSFLMRLKEKIGLPYGSVLSEKEYEKVKHAAKNLNDENVDFDLRMFAYIAKQGGWRGRKSDPISPLTLIRGFDRVTVALDMIENASDLLEEFARRCEVFKKRVY